MKILVALPYPGTAYPHTGQTCCEQRVIPLSACMPVWNIMCLDATVVEHPTLPNIEFAARWTHRDTPHCVA